jgi:hypothetical protein
MATSFLKSKKILLIPVIALLPVVAFAQAPPSPLPKAPPEIPAPSVTDQKACAQQGLSVSPDDKAVRSETTGQTLSEQLARTEGVICPPADVDSDIKAPTPPTGNNMPVIPPPGSPGGDQSIRPK